VAPKAKPKALAPTDLKLELNCLVLGENVDRFFRIEIVKEKQVSHLKDVIHRNSESHYRVVHDRDLVLWKVNNTHYAIAAKLCTNKIYVMDLAGFHGSG